MTAKLIEYRTLCPDVRHFVFEAPDVTRLEFTPGQFVSFSEEFDGKKITRAYSICSAPDGNRFELCLNEVKEGRFSPHLFRMQPGDAVAMRGPLGQFVLRQPVRDSIFVATGTGIAPFRAMLADARLRASGASLHLIFGARYEHGLLYREEFEALAKEYPQFRFTPTITRPGGNWTGRTGRVQPVLLDVIGDRRDLDVYVCGLKEMVDDVRGLLKERGFDRKQIVYEKYD
ncbi:MAG: FAD-binding oxidoreductase [Bryobacteraceae bacterium]|nr:FAD-binding oxidoreductase [Bryobacteraceae bacterium]